MRMIAVGMMLMVSANAQPLYDPRMACRILETLNSLHAYIAIWPAGTYATVPDNRPRFRCLCRDEQRFWNVGLITPEVR